MKRAASMIIAATLAVVACGGASGGNAFEKRINGMKDCDQLESEREMENDLRLAGHAGSAEKVVFIHNRMVKEGC